MWLSLAKLALKTGAEVYKNKKETQQLESIAQKKQMERIVSGEIEYKAKVIESQKNDWKDEFCLILLSIPLLLLAWSVFSDDPNIQAKIDIFFDKFSNLPLFYQTLVVGSFSAILGIRGASVLKKK
jgi:hypothetical protein|tara:strand:- start:136 stop:513 length:378 start_codon:yes stop_codon:yes gene_type:complete